MDTSETIVKIESVDSKESTSTEIKLNVDFSNNNAPIASTIPQLNNFVDRNSIHSNKQRHNEIKPKLNASPGKKNFLQKIYEIKSIQPILFDVVSKEGEDHKPIFKICLKIMLNNEKHDFYGTGCNIKEAKLSASEQALQYLLNQNCLSNVQEILEIRSLLIEKFTPSEKSSITPVATVESAIPKPIFNLNTNKNPINLLQEMLPKTAIIDYDIINEFLDKGAKQFKMQLKLKLNSNEDEKFIYACGSNKKQAKLRCAQMALESLFNIKSNDNQSFDNSFVVTNTYGFESLGIPAQQIKSKYKSFRQFADLLYGYVNGAIEEVKAQMENDFVKQHYVYSAIIQTNEYHFDDTTKLICLTTGTKCINGEYMSQIGLSLNDCHAEILAIRILRRYLYDQLERFIQYLINNNMNENSNNNNEFLFELVKDEDTNITQFRLKTFIKFHLYISTTPCGDGRIFSPHENSDNVGVDSHPNRKIRGLLRAKIESGMGTIPIGNQCNVQTWDGIIQGERLKIMSCSDKLCKANVLGIQGALLDYFLEKPIYFDSIICGSFYHSDHLSRALYGRVDEKVTNLTNGFKVHKPILSTITNVDTRQLAKTSNKAILWFPGIESNLEIVNTKEGKLVNGKHSSICKAELFNRWCNVYNLLETNNFNLKYKTKKTTYSDVKYASVNYQNAKKCLYESFKKSGLGYWIRKPFEQNYFEHTQIQ